MTSHAYARHLKLVIPSHFSWHVFHNSCHLCCSAWAPTVLPRNAIMTCFCPLDPVSWDTGWGNCEQRALLCGVSRTVYLVRRGMQCSAAILPSIPTLASWSENWSRSSSWSSLISSSSREATPLAVYWWEEEKQWGNAASCSMRHVCLWPCQVASGGAGANLQLQLSRTPF